MTVKHLQDSVFDVGLRFDYSRNRMRFFCLCGEGSGIVKVRDDESVQNGVIWLPINRANYVRVLEQIDDHLRTHGRTVAYRVREVRRQLAEVMQDAGVRDTVRGSLRL